MTLGILVEGKETERVARKLARAFAEGEGYRVKKIVGAAVSANGGWMVRVEVW